MKMDDIKNLQGNYFSKMLYRGENIFTLMLKEKLEDDIPTHSINIISCISLRDDGICGKKFVYFDSNVLGFSARTLIEKRNLNINDYIQVVIFSESEGGSKHELMAICKKVDHSSNIHLYNPISEDKYPEQPSKEELRKM